MGSGDEGDFERVRKLYGGSSKLGRRRCRLWVGVAEVWEQREVRQVLANVVRGKDLLDEA